MTLNGSTLCTIYISTPVTSSPDGQAEPDTTFGNLVIGKWEGDTLIVDTRGFVGENDWLDFGGHPATDALHFVERYRRRDFGHMDIQFTVDDSKAYMKPWTFTVPFDLLPDTELIEQICDNEKDAAHLVGK